MNCSQAQMMLRKRHTFLNLLVLTSLLLPGKERFVNVGTWVKRLENSKYIKDYFI